ncbi:unnamed protein product [Zymoseptoria tritici ST99CH_1E4]|uniref:DUF7918 domain-containing protein n=1 Tax=Zymoseptoria tritici ST99CH_1E4 TaxID=1276532 RepID=A0A2H1H0C5_ZYMTR|nr:unnamed protein product [Zymoseptoria tritici ST99CH_1E4]
MFDDTGTVEVTIRQVEPVRYPEVQRYPQYEESSEVFGDNLYQADVHVVKGEQFAIFVELGDHFNFHDNKTLKIQVSIDGGAANICQYLDEKDHYQGPLHKKIDEVRARVTTEYLPEEDKPDELYWCDLVFGQLQALETRAFPVTLPLWGDLDDHDTITVRLELGNLEHPARNKGLHRGPEAHQTESLNLIARKKAMPVKHRSLFYKGRRPPITFRFPYWSKDKSDVPDCKPPRHIPRQFVKQTVSKKIKRGKRSREEYEVDDELVKGPKSNIPDVTFKRIKQEDAESSLLPKNPQWNDTFGGGRN